MLLGKIAALFKKKKIDLQAQYNLPLFQNLILRRVTNLHQAAVYPTWASAGRRCASEAPGKVEAAL